MTPGALLWREHFARCEEEQSVLFPPSAPQTPLERAQAELAFAYLRGDLPVADWMQAQDRPAALRADAPTRWAFFEHFGTVEARDIFCFPAPAWEAVRQSFSEKFGEQARRNWVLYGHEFKSCATMTPKEIDLLLGQTLPDDIARETLFLRVCGVTYAPLVARWVTLLCHWNGEALVPLPEYGSMSIS